MEDESTKKIKILGLDNVKSASNLSEKLPVFLHVYRILYENKKKFEKNFDKSGYNERDLVKYSMHGSRKFFFTFEISLVHRRPFENQNRKQIWWHRDA